MSSRLLLLAGVAAVVASAYSYNVAPEHRFRQLASRGSRNSDSGHDCGCQCCTNNGCCTEGEETWMPAMFSCIWNMMFVCGAAVYAKKRSVESKRNATFGRTQARVLCRNSQTHVHQGENGTTVSTEYQISVIYTAEGKTVTHNNMKVFTSSGTHNQIKQGSAEANQLMEVWPQPGAMLDFRYEPGNVGFAMGQANLDQFLGGITCECKYICIGAFLAPFILVGVGAAVFSISEEPMTAVVVLLPCALGPITAHLLADNNTCCFSKDDHDGVVVQEGELNLSDPSVVASATQQAMQGSAGGIPMASPPGMSMMPAGMQANLQAMAQQNAMQNQGHFAMCQMPQPWEGGGAAPQPQQMQQMAGYAAQPQQGMPMGQAMPVASMQMARATAMPMGTAQSMPVAGMQMAPAQPMPSAPAVAMPSAVAQPAAMAPAPAAPAANIPLTL